jgi:hypothetical protein
MRWSPALRLSRADLHVSAKRAMAPAALRNAGLGEVKLVFELPEERRIELLRDAPS